MIKLRKDQLKDEGELEKVKKKRRLDFLDILLFARVSVYHRACVSQRVCLGAHSKEQAQL